MPALSMLFFFMIKPSVLISFSLLLQTYVGKGIDAKNPAILRFLIVSNRKKQKIAIESGIAFFGNTHISREPLVGIPRNLPLKYFGK